jgi:hypothetical protein
MIASHQKASMRVGGKTLEGCDRRIPGQSEGVPARRAGLVKNLITDLPRV